MNYQERARGVKRAWNWQIWTGFLLALAVIPVYFVFFAKYPITRDVPWASWMMFTVAGWLLWTGVRRAFASSGVYRGKIAGPILAVLSLGAAVFFGYATLYASRQLPAAAGAPRVGEKAPELRSQTPAEIRWRCPHCSPSQCRGSKGKSHEGCSWFSTGDIGDRSATPSCGVFRRV